jgi:hypothetical protein
LRLIKKLLNNRTVIFDHGVFDEWCVFLVENDGKKHAPLDKTYFAECYRLSKKYGKDKLYQDFLTFYHQTNHLISDNTLKLIDQIVLTYLPEDMALIEQWFTVIYAGMIAEENKKNAILKKRVKALGMYQVLILNLPAEEAAVFSKGKKWKELDMIMKGYGI